jgi:hypothetical protein
MTALGVDQLPPGTLANRAAAWVDALCGLTPDATGRSLEIVRAEKAALAWVRSVTGEVDPRLAARVHERAILMRIGLTLEQPALALIKMAAQAVAARTSERDRRAALMLGGLLDARFRIAHERSVDANITLSSTN